MRKKIICIICICLMLFSTVVSAEQNDTSKVTSKEAAIQTIDLKCGTETVIQLKAKNSKKTVWNVINDRDPKTRNKIIETKELKNGKLLVQGLLQGKSTITATSGNKVYKYKVIVHTNGFQRQKTTMYVNNKPFGAGKDVWQYEMSWDKIKDADGYIIYGVYRGNERAEKIKVIHNRNQVKWIYRTENYQAFNFFAIKAYKKTKAGITLYSKYSGSHNGTIFDEMS